MSDKDIKNAGALIAVKIDALRSELSKMGLWRTFHLANKVSRGLGLEIAEKLGDKKACDNFDEKINHA